MSLVKDCSPMKILFSFVTPTIHQGQLWSGTDVESARSGSTRIFHCYIKYAQTEITISILLEIPYRLRRRPVNIMKLLPKWRRRAGRKMSIRGLPMSIVVSRRRQWQGEGTFSYKITMKLKKFVRSDLWGQAPMFEVPEPSEQANGIDPVVFGVEN